ncbi:MAG: histidine--tRNA ligase, partial [Candidatus Komeilibacteria bacterium CG_4_9_14_3_um_filter_37_5]
ASVIDAQIINIGYKFLKFLNLPVIVDINSLGCPTCRAAFVTALLETLKGKKNQLCEDCKRRIVKNPLRVLDCKEEGCQKVCQDTPQQVDYLCDPCRLHFISTLEYLDDLEVRYNLNPKIVRGLDYYTRTSFEYNIESTEEAGRQVALGGGGRYDGLAEELGGRPTPAIGFALGAERIVRELKERDIKVAEKKTYDIFIAQLGQEARKKSLGLLEKMLEADIAVAESMAKDSLKGQLELANKLNVKYTLILGQKEMVDGTVLIRDMEGGIQEVVDFNKTIIEVKKRLRGRLEGS